MAYISTTKTTASLSALFARPFTAFWNGLIAVAEAHPKMKAVTALNAQTDEDLAKRGTDRSAEVRRIFAGHFHI